MAILQAETTQEALGETLQYIANGLSYARLLGAGMIAAYNLRSKQPRNWTAAIVTGAIYTTDKADGIFARQAAKYLRRPPTNAGKTLDQTIDKAAHYLITGSQIYDAWNENETVFTLSLLGASSVQLCRDVVVNHKRLQADKNSQATGKPINIGSIPSSKRKMMLIASADVATQSPIANTAAGRFVIGLAHSAGTVMSLTSGSEIINQINSGLSPANIDSAIEID